VGALGRRQYGKQQGGAGREKNPADHHFPLLWLSAVGYWLSARPISLLADGR
jgi:hypothetical protein